MAGHGGRNGAVEEVVAEVVECHQSRRLNTPNMDDLLRNNNVAALDSTAFGRNNDPFLFHFPVATQEHALELLAPRS